MDIRLKSDLVKRSGIQSADKLPTLNHKNQTIVHSDNQGGMLEHDQVVGEQRNAGIHVEELNPDDTMVETSKEGQPETLEVYINDELGMTHQNEPKTLRAGNNPVIGERVEDESEMTGEEGLGLNFVIKDEILKDIVVGDALKPDVVSPTNFVEELALVSKAVEYIVDCDSD